MAKDRTNKLLFGDTSYPGLGMPDGFYDRSLRLWTLLWKDEQGNQVGFAEHFPLKHLMVRAVREQVIAAGLVPHESLEALLPAPKTASAPSL